MRTNTHPLLVLTFPYRSTANRAEIFRLSQCGCRSRRICGLAELWMLRFKTNHASSCYALYVKADFASEEPYRMSSTLDSKNQFHRNAFFSFGEEKYCPIDATSPLRSQFACFVQSSFNKCRWIYFVNFPETGHIPCW